jgi:hypothetical protein
MSDYLAGHIIGGPADADYDGAVLTQALSIGDTALHVDDVADFDEDASKRGAAVMLDVNFDINGDLDTASATTLAYTTCDDDLSTVTLAAPSPVAGDVGDRVYIQDPVTGHPVGRLSVWVAMDDDDTSGDALRAVVDISLMATVDDMDLTDLAVDVEIDEDDQLVIRSFPGLTQAQSEVKFMQDQLTVTAAGDQILTLTYRPITNSEHLYWDGDYQPGSEWARDAWDVTIPDPTGVIEIGDTLVMEYAYKDPTTKPAEGAPESGTFTIDVPGVVYEYDHAGSPGGVVGGVGAVSSADDDTSYVWFGNPGGANSTYGWQLFVKFPPTTLPVGATLDSTSLVIRSKGPDARTIMAPYLTAHGLVPANYAPQASSTLRDPALYTTPPTYGFLADGFWHPIRTEDAAYHDDVTPLIGPWDSTTSTQGTGEFVTARHVGSRPRRIQPWRRVLPARRVRGRQHRPVGRGCRPALHLRRSTRHLHGALMKRLPLHNLDPAGATEGDVATVVGGKWAPAAPTGGSGGSGGTALVPLISVTAGVPSLVFDADNQLVMTEVPL